MNYVEGLRAEKSSRRGARTATDESALAWCGLGRRYLQVYCNMRWPQRSAPIWCWWWVHPAWSTRLPRYPKLPGGMGLPLCM